MRAIPGFELRGARGAQAAPQSRRLATTALALIGAFSLLLSACSIGGNGANSVSLASNQTFTWPYVNSLGVMGHNVVLDPAIVSSLYDYQIVSVIYTNLVTFTPTLQIAPDAATSWDISSDGKSYTFHLRHGLKFSDGTPITASDFAYSLDRALDANLCAPDQMGSTYPTQCFNVASAHLNYLVGADARLGGSTTPDISNGANSKFGLNVIDQFTLRINLTTPIRFFLDALTYPTGDAVEKSLIDKYGGAWVDHLNSGGDSGPFQVKSYGSGKVMTLVPNPYWETAFGKKLTLTQIQRPVVTTDQAEYTAYDGGQYSYTDVSASQYQFARGQRDFNYVDALDTNYFALNWDQPPFDNKSVRQAFDLALNKQLLVDSQESGAAVPTNHIVPQGMPGFYANLTNPSPDNTQTLTGNPDAASTLMKQARALCASNDPFFVPPDFCPYITGSQPQEIDIWAPNDDATRVSLAEAATQMWNNALGVNVHVKAAPFSQIYPNTTLPASADPMQMWEIGWIADYPDPQDWLSIQFTRPQVIQGHITNFNGVGMNDPNFDSLVQQADTEADSTLRMQYYNQAEQLAVDDVGWIPFEQSKLSWRLRTNIHGFSYNGMGVMSDLSWPNVYISRS